MQRVLFICTGNTCRSPMAQTVFAQLLAADGTGPDQVMIESAGLYASQGMPASKEAVEVLAAEGIDLTQHRARPVTDELLESADLVLTMTRDHRDRLWDRYPYLKNKIFMLAEYAGQPEAEISDPFGQGIQAYQETLQQIKYLLAMIVKSFNS